MTESQYGSGWKTKVGATLVGIGSITGAGSIAEKNVDQAIGSAIFAGLGSYLIYKDKKGKKGKGMHGYGNKKIDSFIHGHLKDILKRNPHHISGGQYAGGLALAGGRRITHKHAKDFLSKHKNRLMSVQDVFGKDWKSKSRRLIQVIEHAKKIHDQEGGNIFKDIGKSAKKAWSGVKKGAKTIYHEAKKVRDEAYHSVKKWANGDYKFKPSDLVRYTGYAIQGIGAASSLLDAGVISLSASSAINAGLQVGSKLLAESGRGLPKKYANFIRLNPEKVRVILREAKKRQAGRGVLKKIALGATGLALYGYLKENPHLIDQIANAAKVHLGGMNMPAEYVPYAAKKLVETLSNQAGSAMSKTKLGVAIGLTGASLVAAHSLYKRLRKQRGKGLKLAGTGLYGGEYRLSGNGIIPANIQKFINKHSRHAEAMAKALHGGGQYGMGFKGFIKAAGLTSIGAVVGASTLYKYMLSNPGFTAKLAAKGGIAALKGSIGSGLALAGGRSTYGSLYKEEEPRRYRLPDHNLNRHPVIPIQKRRRKKMGKLIGKMHEVWNPDHPAQITSGGKFKDDLMLNKKGKVISKLKHLQGKKLYDKYIRKVNY